MRNSMTLSRTGDPAGDFVGTNLTFTTTVPEPALLGFALLTIPALVLRRRSTGR